MTAREVNEYRRELNAMLFDAVTMDGDQRRVSRLIRDGAKASKLLHKKAIERGIRLRK